MSDSSPGGGRRGGFGRRSKKTAQRQRTPDAPDAADEGGSFPTGFLLRFLGWFFDNTSPDPNNEPWHFKHYFIVIIPVIFVPAGAGFFVFDDPLLGVGSGLAASGLFSIIFGVSFTMLRYVMLIFRNRGSIGLYAINATPIVNLEKDVTKEEASHKIYGIHARIMGLFYFLLSLLFMPFIDGRSVAMLLYLATNPEGQ